MPDRKYNPRVTDDEMKQRQDLLIASAKIVVNHDSALRHAQACLEMGKTKEAAKVIGILLENSYTARQMRAA